MHADENTNRKIVILFDNVLTSETIFNFGFYPFGYKLHAFEESLCFFDLSTKPVFYQILYFSQFDPPAITMVSPIARNKTIVTNVGKGNT